MVARQHIIALHMTILLHLVMVCDHLHPMSRRGHEGWSFVPILLGKGCYGLGCLLLTRHHLLLLLIVVRETQACVVFVFLYILYILKYFVLFFLFICYQYLHSTFVMYNKGLLIYQIQNPLGGPSFLLLVQSSNTEKNR